MCFGMVKQLLSTVYQIKKVIEGPKLVEENGKKVPFYKVRWQDTYEVHTFIPLHKVYSLILLFLASIQPSQKRDRSF